MIEEVENRAAVTDSLARRASIRAGSAAPGGLPEAEVVALESVASGGEAARISTDIGELDRVLGGGLVSGATVLLGGDPGIGKSTLALHMASGVAHGGRGVLYVCGEESAAQVALRAERLGAHKQGIVTLSAIDTGSIIAAAQKQSPALVIVDSIQTVCSPHLDSAPGSVSQVRESASELVAAARGFGAATVFVGHVTKEGYLAGPRVLEHLVDTVLYFEGDRNHAYRILRAVKNRFGAANEIGVFEMLAGGLAEVADPSEVFLRDADRAVAGSAISCAMEGSRPMVVEVQALVAPSNPGSARRTALGVDHGRVAMLAAVMEKRLGLSMIAQDIFVNTAGGVRVADPGVDLAVMAALASSYVDRPLPPRTIIVGEAGLTGEVRPVAQLQARLKEAARLGFESAVTPAGGNAEAGGIRILEARSVSEAWSLLSGQTPSA